MGNGEWGAALLNHNSHNPTPPKSESRVSPKSKRGGAGGGVLLLCVIQRT
ncbi:MAG: hypothetical protein DSM106950_42455 [Stigonema ocellatum SAG 48.90 = DSM 106950]|nr:hypothetical protein [Stigonema ocellatum SAG 48.90 = DSM 106950]